MWKRRVLKVQALNTGQNNMLILQESCIDSSGSLVVYCPVELPSINVAMSGEDPSYIPLLPSGFTISPDGRPDHHQMGGGDGASTSSSVDKSSPGSLITVVFQIIVSSSPTMNPETVNTVNNLIGDTIQQIKAALNSWWSSFLLVVTMHAQPIFTLKVLIEIYRSQERTVGCVAVLLNRLGRLLNSKHSNTMYTAWFGYWLLRIYPRMCLFFQIIYIVFDFI